MRFLNDVRFDWRSSWRKTVMLTEFTIRMSCGVHNRDDDEFGRLGLQMPLLETEILWLGKRGMVSLRCINCVL